MKTKKLNKLFRKKHLLILLSIGVISVIGAIILSRSYAAISPPSLTSQYQLPVSADGHRMLQTGLLVENVDPASAPYYWAMESSFLNASGAYPNGVAYIGMQTFGSRVNGTQGKTAVFSIFGADISGTSGNCVIQRNNFDGFGGVGGTSCRIPYEWLLGRQYQLKISYSGTNSLGRVWTGYITDTATGAVTKIGDINIPGGWTNGLNNTPIVWTEYFGNFPNTCPEVPLSRIRFYTPSSDHGVATANTANYDDHNSLNCTNFKFEGGAGYVVQQQGGATASSGGTSKNPPPSGGKNPAPAPAPTK